MVIKNGTLHEKNLRKELYTINDLLEQLRICNVHNISDVEFGILETNGELSMVMKSQKRPLTPADLGIDTEYEGPSLDIIIDGVVHNENLELADLDTNWLIEQLKSKGWSDPKDIFFASLNSKGELYIQPKWKAVKKRKC